VFQAAVLYAATAEISRCSARGCRGGEAIRRYLASRSRKCRLLVSALLSPFRRRMRFGLRSASQSERKRVGLRRGSAGRKFGPNEPRAAPPRAAPGTRAPTTNGRVDPLHSRAIATCHRSRSWGRRMFSCARERDRSSEGYAEKNTLEESHGTVQRHILDDLRRSRHCDCSRRLVCEFANKRWAEHGK
jgi:hypothetical protein